MKVNLAWVGLIAFVLAAPAHGKAKHKKDGGVDWDELCTEVKKQPLPPEDQPKKDEIAGLKGCDAEALYYGIGKPADYAKARLCAYAELVSGKDAVFGGNGILMMIYANGHGIKADFGVAERFACDLEGAPAETDARLERLEAAKSGETPLKDFDLCDDITSGLMMGFCSTHQQRFAEVKRAADFEALVAQWGDAERAALKKLQMASNQFTEQRSLNEIDQSGSGGPSFATDEENVQRNDFIDSLQKLESGKAPRYTRKQYEAEDGKLNTIYRKLLIKKFDEDLTGTVTKEGIQGTQKAWLAYRNAWIEFAKVKYPKYSADSIAAWFTKKRNHMLSNLLR